MNQETNAPKTNFEIAQVCGADFYPSVDEPLMTFTTDELDNFASRICADKDAEIARLNKLAGIYPSYYQTIAELEKETAQLKALVAMQAHHIRVARKNMSLEQNFYSQSGQSLEAALNASAETVAAWEAKKIEPLRREVAMLHWAAEILIPLARGCVLEHYAKNTITATQCEQAASAINDTQVTAEAFEREVAANALEEAATQYKSEPHYTNEDCTHGVVSWLNITAAELRAKGE